MSKKVLVSGRIDQGHYEQLQQMVELSGKNESQVVREAIAAYLGVNSGGAIGGIDQRLVVLERKINRMQALFLDQV